jgi:hypothetical protein
VQNRDATASASLRETFRCVSGLNGCQPCLKTFVLFNHGGTAFRLKFRTGNAPKAKRLKQAVDKPGLNIQYGEDWRLVGAELL